MSGVVGKNEDRYSGQIAAVIGIETRTTDPAVAAVGVWTSAAFCPIDQYELGYCGTTSAGALTVGGGSNPQNVSYEYTGTTWAAGGISGVNAQSRGGTGSLSAGLIWSYSVTPNTEEYDGTSFSNANASVNYNANYLTGGAGIQTAALSWGGTPSTNPATNSMEYNGTSWSAGGSLQTAVLGSSGCGTQSAALSFGGTTSGVNSGSNTNSCQEYNGSSWAAGGTLSTPKTWLVGSGIQTAARSQTGESGYPWTIYNTGQTYDGSSWTSSENNLTARNRAGSSQQSANDMVMFQGAPGPMGSTEEFVVPTDLVAEGTVWYNSTVQKLKVSAPGVTGGTFTTINNMVTGRRAHAGGGDSAANMYVSGGSTPAETATTKTETFDGTSWSSATDNIEGKHSNTGCGNATAGMSNCGIAYSPAPLSGAVRRSCQIFNGSAWSAAAPVIGARYTQNGGGQVNAAWVSAGYTGGAITNVTELYDGLTWVTSNPNTLSRYQGCGSGNQTSAIMTGGYGSGSWTSDAQTFDGVSWAAIAADLVATNSAHMFGIASDAVRLGGGTSGGRIATSAQYNGTSWVASGSAPVATENGSHPGGYNGEATTGLIAGGADTNSAMSAACYEYTRTLAAVEIN